MGGTMRLGADPVKLHDGTRAREIYGEAGHLRAPPPPLRGQQPPARARCEAAGLVFSRHLARRAAGRGRSSCPTAHPFFVASQYHPEFKSRPERPAPLFREFVRAALERATRAAPEGGAATSRAAPRRRAQPASAPA